jgi:hypothetical protein
MLNITSPYLPPLRSSGPRFAEQARLAVALALLAVALLSLNWFEQPRGFAADQWYGMTTIEGVASYMPYRSEEDCRAGNDDAAICLRGAEFNP